MRRRPSKPAKTVPALKRLGMATPPPFVGRDRELAAMGEALHEGALVVVHGAVGSGKTRLARQLADRPDLIGTLSFGYVRCEPGDRGVAVRARAERILDALPGSLADVLSREDRLLVIDDVHHLAEDDAAVTLGELLPAGTAAAVQGRLILLTRDALPIRRDVHRVEMELGGLDEVSARELWTHLEETYGPTAATACDQALSCTRGMPLALRREYARAAFGKQAWVIAKLPRAARAALEAVAVLRVPAAPAAVAAMLDATAPDASGAEAALTELVSRQLIDPLEDGRFAIHDVVRDDVLGAMDAADRVRLERAGAQVVSTTGRGQPSARRLAWDAGDDGALGHLDPVDRMREAVLHLVNAGDVPAAASRLLDDRDTATRRGAGGEVLALLEILESAIAQAATTDVDDRELRAVRAEIAARQGRVAEALEIGAGGRHLDRVHAAALQYLSGDVAAACRQLDDLCDSDEPLERCRAAAVLAEIELTRGNAARAESLATAAFERDRAAIDESTRARLHLALAGVEDHAGRITAARAALSRAASSGRLEPGLAARIAARRANCLAREGRISDAEEALAEAERAAREVDAVAVADEIRRGHALVVARRGDGLRATAILKELVTGRRQRGDEVGALRAEIDLAIVLARRGELAQAAELAAATASSANRRKLSGLAVRAELVTAAVDVAELRIDAARDVLGRIASSDCADAELRAQAALLEAEIAAWSGAGIDTAVLEQGDFTDDIDAGRARAALALAAGDSAVALDAARAVAVRAERAGRGADLAEALSLCARLQLARGDKSGATAAATRAAREALSCGLSRARANALLVLAALARDEGNVSAASAYARDAAELCAASGLPVERLVAAEAIDAIAGSHGPGGAAEVRNSAAATMTQLALDAAGRMLSDLGLTAVRPYRVVGASGSASFVADANPDLLRMADRPLAIDGVREIIVREGEQIADLRRRSLLKRLLFLFAGAPGQIFSKEEIVQTVWNVEYHPLRHDAALFTNIMRIRRLLGKDGADLIRVSEDGYRFVPPKDFIFVEAVGEE